jgi:predicted DNA-binding antitoxin AbrB/MazE fold protein
MNSTVTAIYENGILRPLTPLALPERARVQVQVWLESPEAMEHRRQVHQALVAVGLSLSDTDVPPVSTPISAQRREELARRFAVAGPLSELIVEEREGR